MGSPFDTILEEVYGPVEVANVLQKLQSGDGVFVDNLKSLGRTQEEVVDVLGKLYASGIEVYVMFNGSPTRVNRDTMAFLRAFRELDVTLIYRAA